MDGAFWGEVEFVKSGSKLPHSKKGGGRHECEGGDGV